MLLSISFITFIIYHLSGIAHNTIADTIDCTTKQCRHTYIDCLPNEDCFIECNESESCLGATINCPIGSGDCNILCEGGQSCRDTIINATLSNGNFNLRCEESVDHCKGIKIYGSILDSNIGNYNISCNGKQRSCVHSYIKCPLNSNCYIDCNSDTSCRWSQIIGPINGNLNIKCNGIYSCFDSLFDGRKSNIFSINGCKADKSCLDLTFYCPSNTNGQKNCFIQGNNNLGRDNAGGTNIYAINGWNDIDINYSGHFGTFHKGEMHCGDNYDISCEIAKDKWSCANKNDYCNFNYIMHNNTSSNDILPILTYLPTNNILPTQLYTTNNILTESTLDIDDHTYDYDYHLTKDRGITWYLEVRIIFGLGVLIIIIIVTICCYIAHSRKKKSFYHWAKVSIPPIEVENENNKNNQNINTLGDMSTFQLDKVTSVSINTNPNTIGVGITTFESIKSPKYDIINIKSPNYNIENQNNNKQETKTISDDILELNPIQVEIVAVRQLLNLRKLMIQKPISHNSDDSDVGSADTNDIIQRNKFIISKSCKSSVSNDEFIKEEEEKEEEKQINININNYKHIHVSTPGMTPIKHNIANTLNNTYDNNEIIEESPKIKPDIISKYEKELSTSLSLKKRFIFRKQKSKSVKSQKKRKITTSMNDEEYIMASIRGDSETEIDSRSETNNTTKSTSECMNNSDNIYNGQSDNDSITDTYNHSQSVRPTAC